MVLDCVQFSKRVFQHRNRVIGVADQPTWLTIPLSTSNHQHLRLPDMRINNATSWQRRYKNILYERYHRYPAWPDHSAYIESLWMRPFDRLLDLNMDIMRYLLHALGVTTPLILASSLNPEGGKSELNLDVCRKVGARTYLAGPLSRNYLNEEIFRRANIEVRYHAFPSPGFTNSTGGVHSARICQCSICY